MGSDAEGLVDFAQRLADAARGETLRKRADDSPVVNKDLAGGFDPVTEADRAAERAMRTLIEREHPDHGIRGEEFLERPARNAFTWSLDPIDGTRSFMCGLPTWTTLIALLHQERPVIGVIDAPRLDELYVGFAREAFLIAGGERRELATSSCTTLAEARLSTTDPLLFAGADKAAFERLLKSIRTTRYGQDAYAYARLAAGTIDLVAETELKPHDLNALVPLVRGAGGTIGNWRGEDDFSEGRVLAAATRPLFEAAVALLKA